MLPISLLLLTIHYQSLKLYKIHPIAIPAAIEFFNQPFNFLSTSSYLSKKVVSLGLHGLIIFLQQQQSTSNTTISIISQLKKKAWTGLKNIILTVPFVDLLSYQNDLESFLINKFLFSSKTETTIRIMALSCLLSFHSRFYNTNTKNDINSDNKMTKNNDSSLSVEYKIQSSIPPHLFINKFLYIISTITTTTSISLQTILLYSFGFYFFLFFPQLLEYYSSQPLSHSS